MLKLYQEEGTLEAGVDEAGRGALAGPVVAAAVVWSPEVTADEFPEVAQIRDSKKLTRLQRERLREFIEECAVAWGVCAVPPADIDRLNILGATMKAMHGALDRLDVPVEHILVDGDHFKTYVPPFPDVGFARHTCVIEGDNTYLPIAAASILAKTHRDEIMRSADMHGKHPAYGWDANSGYGTAGHMAALEAQGPCEHHRLSFAPVAHAAAARGVYQLR